MPIPSRVPQNTQYTIRYFTTALQIYFSNVSAQKYRYFKLSLIYYRDVILLPSPGEEISFMHYFYLQPTYCKESARAKSHSAIMNIYRVVTRQSSLNGHFGLYSETFLVFFCMLSVQLPRN